MILLNVHFDLFLFSDAFSSAPEYSSVWNPSLRKSMSQPAPQIEHDTSVVSGQANGYSYKHLHKASTVPCSSTTALPDATLPTQRCSSSDRSSEPSMLSSSARMHSPTKNRLNLFEGFKNTLRSRNKTEVPLYSGGECDWNSRSSSEENKNSMRRWSESGSPHLVRRQKQNRNQHGQNHKLTNRKSFYP